MSDRGNILELDSVSKVYGKGHTEIRAVMTSASLSAPAR